MHTLREESLKNLVPLLDSKRASVGVFGAGYVGLPLACAFAEAGFMTIAGDTDEEKLRAIRRGHAYVEDDYAREILPRLVASGELRAEHDLSRLASIVNFAVIAVPTPLNDADEPDLTYVVNVARIIAGQMRPGKFIILESSVYPGATDDVVRPTLERSGLKAGDDFGLACSPERIDFGSDVGYNIKRIPKVVGGITPLCTRIATQLYRSVLQAKIVPVSSMRVAEATKMLENTYRYVNIALVNELAILHEKMGIDFFEVIAAASTKPFGFQPFYPGPGVGGHCIPKDPRYLMFRAHQVGEPLNIVEASGEANDRMIRHILERLENRFKAQGRVIRGSKAVIMGLAFKANVSDTRNSPSITMAERLVELGVTISAYDPFVKSVSTKSGSLPSASSLEEAASNADIIVLMTPHKVFKEMSLRKLIAQVHSPATIVDTRGCWSPEECRSAGLDYIGIGRPDGV
jgi:UDP-N-acetyl-D-glucosamine dehydrogenase